MQCIHFFKSTVIPKSSTQRCSRMVKSRCISRSQTPKMAFITHTVSCPPPSYRWENIQGFTAEEIARNIRRSSSLPPI